MNFLETLLERTEDSETPRSFLYWAGLASISAVMKKNVYLNKKMYVLYPNLYLMLVARSGLRKSFATSLARVLVSEIQCTNVISGRSSIQGIISELSKQITFKNGYVLNTASAFIVSSELASAFVQDPHAQIILTDLYDSNYNGEWVNLLKKDGRERLKDLYVTMFSATNEEHLTEFLDPSSIGGGFVARTLIIKEDKRSKINPLIDFDEDEEIGLNLDDLTGYLKEISRLKGKFRLTDAAKDLYRPWYTEISKQAEEGIDFTGTLERLHDHALKVAMCLSLSHRSDLIIDTLELQEAIDVCTGELEGIMVGGGSGRPGKGDLSSQMSIVIDTLLLAEENTISRRELLKKHYKDFDTAQLSRIIDTLEEAGILKVGKGEAGPTYKLGQEYVEQIKSVFRKKKEN